MLPDVRRHCLEALDARVEMIETAVEDVVEKRLFVPVAPWTNSMGNLTLHVSGNLRALVGTIGGGMPYDRDRDREFSERSLSTVQVLETLRSAADVARSVLSTIDGLTWQEVPENPLFEGESRGDHVLRSLDHLSYHGGQIVLIGKILTLLSET